MSFNIPSIPCLRVDGVACEVAVESMGCGLREEIQYGFPLLYQLDGRDCLATEPLDHPGIVKRSQETSGTSRTSGPEWLIEGVVDKLLVHVHLHVHTDMHTCRHTGMCACTHTHTHTHV